MPTLSLSKVTYRCIAACLRRLICTSPISIWKANGVVMVLVVVMVESILVIMLLRDTVVLMSKDDDAVDKAFELMVDEVAGVPASVVVEVELDEKEESVGKGEFEVETVLGEPEVDALKARVETLPEESWTKMVELFGASALVEGVWADTRLTMSLLAGSVGEILPVAEDVELELVLAQLDGPVGLGSPLETRSEAVLVEPSVGVPNGVVEGWTLCDQVAEGEIWLALKTSVPGFEHLIQGY